VKGLVFHLEALSLFFGEKPAIGLLSLSIMVLSPFPESGELFKLSSSSGRQLSPHFLRFLYGTSFFWTLKWGGDILFFFLFEGSTPFSSDTDFALGFLT